MLEDSDREAKSQKKRLSPDSLFFNDITNNLYQSL